MDSGFFDQKIFDVCEKLNIGYLCGGKMYKDVVEMAMAVDDRYWTRFNSENQKGNWEYIEFGNKRGTWKKFRCSLYCRLHNNGEQLYLPGSRPNTMIITNIGQ